MGNHKPKIYNRYTNKRKKNLNITLNIVIKSQGKREKRKISNNLNLHFKELKKKRPQAKNSKSSSNTDIHSDKGLPLEEEKSQINNLTYHLRKLQKKKKKAKPKVNRRKEIIIRGEIEKKTEKINET